MGRFGGTKCCGVVFAATVFAWPSSAVAETYGFEASTSISSGLIDRGEALANLNNETSFTLTHALSFGEAYAALYRISPIGVEASAFDEEVDYTIGIAFEHLGIGLDASANYLTFPGSAEDPSLELAVEVGFDGELSPSVAAFYDIDAEIHGLEAAIGPSIESGDWMLTGIVRGGFVSSADEDYAYGGVEGVISRQLSDKLAFEGFARIEAADAENFVSDIQNDNVIETRKNDSVFGIRFIFQD